MKPHGHYCWCCGRHRANEAFSGRGRARHVCRDCSRLGQEELEYRQHVRNIDRLLGFYGRIPRRQRAAFDRYLRHANERVRVYAEQIKAGVERAHEEFCALLHADEERGG